MKQFIKDFLTFNKRERRGIFVLVTIIVILLIVLNISSLFYKKEAADFSEFAKEIEEFSNQADSSLLYEEEYMVGGNINKSLPERFYFNPNQLDENDWLKLGLTGKQVKAIKNYVAAGGKFHKKEDLKKIYVISEEFYHSVEPYIKIPADTAVGNDINGISFKKPVKKILEIDINNADTSLFKELRGIGGGYAKRIIRYREALGGFASIDQIMEVYGIPPQLFDSIAMYLTVDTSGLVKMNINTCTPEELKKHPYINWNVANAIVAYREKHGPYKNVFDIRKTDLVDEDLYRKIAPYLRLE